MQYLTLSSYPKDRPSSHSPKASPKHFLICAQTHLTLSAQVRKGLIYCPVVSYHKMATCKQLTARTPSPDFSQFCRLGILFLGLGREDGDFFQRSPALPVPQSPISPCCLNTTTEWGACNVQGEDEMGSEVADLGTFAGPASFRGHRQGRDKERYKERKIELCLWNLINGYCRVSTKKASWGRRAWARGLLSISSLF